MYNNQQTSVAAFQRTQGYNYPMSTTTRRKYILVERDHSAVFMIERTTGKVYNAGYLYGRKGIQASTLHNLTHAYEFSERLKLVQ